MINAFPPACSITVLGSYNTTATVNADDVMWSVSDVLLLDIILSMSWGYHTLKLNSRLHYLIWEKWPYLVAYNTQMQSLVKYCIYWYLCVYSHNVAVCIPNHIVKYYWVFHIKLVKVARNKAILNHLKAVSGPKLDYHGFLCWGLLSRLTSDCVCLWTLWMLCVYCSGV